MAQLAPRQDPRRSRHSSRAHARGHDARLEPAHAQGAARARGGRHSPRRRRQLSVRRMAAAGQGQVRAHLLPTADLSARRQLGEMGHTTDRRLDEGTAYRGAASLATAPAAHRLLGNRRGCCSRDPPHPPPRGGGCRGNHRQLLVAGVGRPKDFRRLHRSRARPGRRVRGLRPALSARGEQAGARHRGQRRVTSAR